MDSFKAFRVHEGNGKTEARLETITLDALSEGDVVIRSVWSDVNYKDALAATGKGKIMRRFPMVGGIDVAGYVHSSSDKRYKKDDPVLVTGFGLSEKHDGGYAEYTRVPGDWVVPLPDGLSLYESMALGTAGFTAGLAADRMQHNGQTPDKGPILVNGATGGVGSFAVDMFAGLGFEVTAFTGKRDQDDYLKNLGASATIYRGEVEMGAAPLEKALWGGAVDSVGGDDLAWITRTVRPEGNIASIGLAGGIKLNTTVMPFILRGINLLGINSVFVPQEKRRSVWKRLGKDLKPRHLKEIVTNQVDLDTLSDVFDAYIDGKVAGRTVVRISDE
ncbi:MAG: oxidoreductase [Gammaproteobacteria bacterium]|nr:oxidoreductase [Gammaproteobacteria bacterium]MDH3412119.1 oxidoreductase [Gammaproteobacteria bacterium]